MLRPAQPRKTVKTRMAPGFPSAEVLSATLDDDHVAQITFKSGGTLTIKYNDAEEARAALADLGVKPK
jgi:hypothetical protein